MLIQALCDYADKQYAQKNADMPEGFVEQNIHFRILITPEGKLSDIIDIRKPEKIVAKNGKEKIQKIPRTEFFPPRQSKSSINSEILDHRSKYIFGMEYEKDELKVLYKKEGEMAYYNAFRDTNLNFLKDVDSPVAKAVCSFIENWNPEAEVNNEILFKLGKELNTSSFDFAVSGSPESPLEKETEVIERYFSDYAQSDNETDSENMGICGVSGKKAQIARLHDKLKFPGGQSSGCQLVCMNDTAFESYGKTQSFNSNVSEKVMKKYTKTFNKLLADKNHHFNIEDMTIVYFAMKNNDSNECDLFSLLLGNNSIENEKVNQELHTFMDYTKSGYTADTDTLKEFSDDKNITFYVAGFSPNASRICQKFICRSTFGDMMSNLIKHQMDICINEKNTKPVYFYSIGRELVSPNSKDDKVSSPLMTAIFMSAFNNTKYPDSLLATVVRRVKTDNDTEKNHYIKLNDIRAGLIKACINRKNNKEEITMSWNEENKNPAYLCGGLFAVYEKIQQDSSGGNLNRTIKDSYFSSACSRPASVFPKLAKLAQNHMRKLSEGTEVYYNKIIGNITDGLSGEFPSTLTLDDQGRFIVGYYQMNKKLYTSNKSE